MALMDSDAICELGETHDNELEIINKFLKDYHYQQEREKTELIKVILEQLQSTPTNTIIPPTESIDVKGPTVTISTVSLGVSTAWTFTQGLIIGQISVILLLCAFIKFFVFTEASPIQAPPIKINIKPNDDSQPSSSSSLNISAATMSKTVSKGRAEFKDSNDIESDDDILKQILEKTYYDVNKHQAESLDWFNVLIAQIISQGRFEALVNDNIQNSLNDALNQPQILQYCDRLNITEVNIGNDYPIFSNCRVKNNDGRLEAKIDVDVADTFTLGIETNLLINQPRFMSACLPIKLKVSLVRFSSCLTVSLVTTNKEDEEVDEKRPKKGNSIGLMFAFSPDFRLEFDIKSLIGSKAKLENIPRISSLIENVLRKWFIDRCIEPRFQLIKLPSLWPRKKNTRLNNDDNI